MKIEKTVHRIIIKKVYSNHSKLKGITNLSLSKNNRNHCR